MSIFETQEWFANLAETCPDLGATAFLLHIEDANCASFMALRRTAHGDIESLSNYYASLFGVVMTDQLAVVAHAPHYGKWLAECGASVIRLHPLDMASDFNRLLADGMRQHRCWVDSYFAFGNWFHSCAGETWAEYLSARPSRLRNTIVRTRKKLHNDAAFSLSIVDGTSDKADLEQSIAAFGAVYARSWKQAEPYSEFIPGFFRFAHARGWLRLAVGHLDGEAIAAQAWTVKSGVASIFKLAYDAEHAKRGAGTVLSAALSEHVLDRDHVREIDFLTGDDNYKAEWMSHRRERVGLIAFRQTKLRGLLEACRHFGSRALGRMRARRAVPAKPASDTGAGTDASQQDS